MGYNFNLTAQLRKQFGFGLRRHAGLQLHQGEEQPQVHRDRERALAEPADAGQSQQPGARRYSEFGQRHRIVGGATYVKPWSPTLRTSIGLFVEVAEGNRFAGAGGNRYSFIYSGDVNGDGRAATT